MIKVEVQKNLIGVEDMLLGFGTVTQQRGDTSATVTKFNAGSLPFSETQTLIEASETAAEQIAFLQANQALLTSAVEVITLLQQLSVNIDQLAAWLVAGNVLSPFQAYNKTVATNTSLASNLNFTMLEDTVINPGVSITLGANTKLYIIKGEEVTP